MERQYQKFVAQRNRGIPRWIIWSLGMMRRLLYALPILSSFLGWIKETIVTAKYTVRNDSGKEIIVKSYLSKKPQILPVVTKLSNGVELSSPQISRSWSMYTALGSLRLYLWDYCLPLAFEMKNW